MKKIFFTLFVLLVIMFSGLTAQESVITNKPKSLFFQGKEMFFTKNYVGTTQTLNDFLNNSSDVLLNQEAEYYILASHYYLNDKNIDAQLKAYIEKYPSTAYRNSVCFFLGSNYFAVKDWNQAKYWFDQVDPIGFTESEFSDFYFRTAYISLQSKEYPRAANYFRKSMQSAEYQTASSYYLAYIDFQEQNYSKAASVFQLLSKKGEYKEKSMFFLSQIAFVAKDYDEALEYASACLPGKSTLNVGELHELYRVMGSSSYNLGQDNKAFEYYKQMQAQSGTVETFPLDEYRLGELYYKHQEYDKAIQTLTKVASADDLIGQSANMMLGQSYLKLDNTTKALMYFDLAARGTHSSPLSEEALYNYVMLTNRTSDVFGQSIEAFKRFLQKYPDSKYKTEVNDALAQILLSTHDYDLALATIEAVKNPSPSLLAAKQIVCYQQGVQYFLNKNFSDAIKKFDFVIDMKDYDLEVRKDAFFWRAEALFQTGNYEDAAQDFSSYVQAVSLSEKNYLPALYNMGYAYFKEKEYAKALSSFSKYTTMEDDKKTPIYADALNRMGDCYLFRKDYNDALKYYSEAATLSPSNADYAHFQRAFVLGLQKDYNKKIAVLNEMMANYPESTYYPNALFEKSRAYVMLKNEKEAIKYLEQLLGNYPMSNLSSKAGVQVGQLYFNQSNNNQAIKAYKQVMEKYPNTEDAVTAMNSLEAVYKDINDINAYVSYVNSLGSGNTISSSRQDTLNFQAAENIYMKGKRLESEKALGNYIASYPQGRFVSDANFYMGTMAFEQGDKNKALVYFREVIKAKNPKYMDESLIYVSGIEYDNKNYDEAYAYYKQLEQVTSNTKNKSVANLGMLRSAYLLSRNPEVIEVATSMLKDKGISEDVAMETYFYRGKAYGQQAKLEQAYKDLEKVAANTRTQQGAESKYLMAEILYKQNQYDKTISFINDFMTVGTPHKDWMAKSVILLSDAYNAKGDKDQALQLLESLKANYNGGREDIQQILNDKLNTLKSN